MTPNLRLYVWEDVLSDYTDGVMFALAESVEEARAIIMRDHNGWEGGAVHSGLQREPKVCETPIGFAVWGGG